MELNSNPLYDEENNIIENYFFIGKKDKNNKWITDGTKPYLKYDADGNLEMKVSSLDLTGTSLGINLVNNTMPYEPPDTMGLKYWYGSDGIMAVSINDQEMGSVIRISGGVSHEDIPRKIYQYLDPDKKESAFFASGVYYLTCDIRLNEEDTNKPTGNIIFRLGEDLSPNNDCSCECAINEWV
jgi:hypothetical protein